MFYIFKKEFNLFLSSLIGYIVMGVFLLMSGLFLWVFPDTGVLDNSFATMNAFFDMAPWILMFLIPAITMRSFAEEKAAGTLELLMTKPLRNMEIVLGKYLAAMALVVIAVLPTLTYYWSIHYLGSPPGNIDSGATFGSYTGLLLLGTVFTAIGIYASSLTNNQIVSFILAMFLCLVLYYFFGMIASLPVFMGKTDDFVQMLGLQYHYERLSRGAIDSRNALYFLSLAVLFLYLTRYTIQKH